MGRLYLRILFCFDLLLICYFYFNFVMLMGMFWQNQALDFGRTGVSIFLPAVKKRSLLLSRLKRRTRYKDNIRIRTVFYELILCTLMKHRKCDNPFQIIPEGPIATKINTQQQQNSTASPSQLLQIFHILLKMQTFLRQKCKFCVPSS